MAWFGARENSSTIFFNANPEVLFWIEKQKEKTLNGMGLSQEGLRDSAFARDCFSLEQDGIIAELETIMEQAEASQSQ